MRSLETHENQPLKTSTSFSFFVKSAATIQKRSCCEIKKHDILTYKQVRRQQCYCTGSDTSTPRKALRIDPFSSESELNWM